MELIEKFLKKLPNTLTENYCWEWQGIKDKQNYGILHHNRKNLKAHRISYEIYYSEPLGELYCLHKCDNPSCVNPNHLFSGTNLDNMRDKVKKGRCFTGNQKGEKNGSSKLKDKDVIDIRYLYSKGITKKQLAKKYNIHEINVYYIITNKTWKHLL